MVQSAEDRMSRRAPARRTQQFGCGLLVIADSAVMVQATQDIGSAVTACSARGWKERLVEDPETGAAAQADGVSETRRAFCGARGDKPQRRPRDAGVRFETALSGQVDGSPTNVTKGRKRRKRRRGRKVFAHDALTQGRVRHGRRQGRPADGNHFGKARTARSQRLAQHGARDIAEPGGAALCGARSRNQ